MALYKRGQVWHMSFICNGKRYRKSTETGDRKLAQRIYNKVRGQIAEGKWFERLPGEDKTFKEMVTKFTEENIPMRSKVVYQSILKTFSKTFNDLPLTSITTDLVNKFKKNLRDEGKKTGGINHKLRVLKRMFNVATMEWGWFKENPIRLVHLESKEMKRDRWITVDDEIKILSHSPEWLKDFVIFAVNTGLRVGEIVGLAWTNVDLFRRTLTVVKSKNDEPRTIPMNVTVFEMLKEKSKVRSIMCDKVFQMNGRNFYKRRIQYAFKETCKKAGLSDLHFHDLRHTFATRLVQARENLYNVQILLGHKSPIMTQRYAHHNPESLRGSVEVLDHIATKMTQIKHEENASI